MSHSRKGQNQLPFARPDSYVHPSLQRSTPTAAQRDTGTSSESQSTVNAQLAHLRRAQGRRAPPPTLYDTLRLGTHTISTPRRRGERPVAGPPAPRSWTEPKSSQSTLPSPLSKAQAAGSSRLAQVDSLPGVKVPDVKSLEHQVLRAIAADFEWHSAYDHIYLSTLSMNTKVLLLSYISRYRPIGGVTVAELKVLFADEKESGLEESTGAENLERLDLSRSVGHTMYLKELETYLFGNRRRSNTFDWDTLPDSWDSADIPSSLASSPLMFPHLTSLSLAYPGSSVSWRDLLQFSRNLGALTHLSLAKWPAPTLPSAGTRTATPQRARDILNLNDEEQTCTCPIPTHPSPHALTQSYCPQGADATHLLKLLSRNTPSLRWLNLDSCHLWLPALRHACQLPSAFARAGSGFVRRLNMRRMDMAFSPNGVPVYTSDEEREKKQSKNPWTTSWKHLNCLVIRQEAPVPAGLDASTLRQLSKFQPAGQSATDGLAATAGKVGAQQGQHQQRFAMGEPETYTIHAPCIQTTKQIAASLARDTWVRAEWEVLLLAGAINRTRVSAGIGVVVVDRGWSLGDA